MENNDKYIFYRETRESVDMQTGEIVGEQRIEKRRVPQEPQFIKLYLSHVLMLSDIPKGLNVILYELLRKMNYDNEIVWNKGIKQRICEKLGCSESNVRKAITEFKKKDILIEQVPGVFLINPYVFGKGGWENVHQLRLTVDINPQRQIISGTVVNDNYTERINNDELEYHERRELSALRDAFAPVCCLGKEVENICGIVSTLKE